MTMTTLLAPLSVGELFDKITILRIKAQRIGDEHKLANIRQELAALEQIADAILLTPKARACIEKLQETNTGLWDIEDAIRDCEKAQDFSAEFVRLARSVYHTNDCRAALKRELNLELGSALVEEKSYAAY